MTPAEKGQRSQSFPDMFPDTMDEMMTKITRHAQKIYRQSPYNHVEHSLMNNSHSS